MPCPSPATLRSLLAYDASTGALTWRSRQESLFSAPRFQRIWNTKNAGKRIVATDRGGYFILTIFGRVYRSHRVIWAMQTDAWPTGEIDHIDGNRQRNAWVNLRHVTRQQNNRNARQPRHNTSGCIGVYHRKKYGDWKAAIGVNGRSQHIGVFATYEEAVAARKDAERRIGFHTNHGRRG